MALISVAAGGRVAFAATMLLCETVGDAAQPGTPPVGRPRASRPRDAATLILVDQSQGEPRILMGRRNRGHSFMPGKWVFPGGRIERHDYRIPCASELRTDVADALGQELPASRARALALAAVRETFEETGLLLCAASALSCGHESWRDFFARGVAPALEGISYVARMITPPQRSKRFDTRFLMADASGLLSREPVDSRELEDVHWVSLEQARRLELPAATGMMLPEVAARLRDPDRPFFFRRFRELAT